MCLRIWSAVRNWPANIFRWRGIGATKTPAYKDTISRLTQFSDEATELFTKAWSILDAKVCLRIRCELHFFLDVEFATIGKHANGAPPWPPTYPCIAKCIFEAVDIARARGRNLAHEARLEQLAINLRNGAGPAHRLTNVDNLLPPLQLSMAIGEGSDMKQIRSAGGCGDPCGTMARQMRSRECNC